MPTPLVIHLANGRMKNLSNRAQVKQFVRHLLDHAGPGGSVIHFHGGLVNYNAGMEVAVKLDKAYREAEALPIFFVWESGLLETVRNNLGELAKEKLFDLLWRRVAEILKRKALKAIGLKSATLPVIDTTSTDEAIDKALEGTSFDAILQDEIEFAGDIEELNEAEITTLEQELQRDFPLTTEIKAVSNSLMTPLEIAVQKASKSSAPVKASKKSLMDPEALSRYVDRPAGNEKGIIEVAKFIAGVVKIAARCIKRFKNGRDHGLHATVVEEILRELYVGNVGGTIWELMKKDTLDAFEMDPDTYGGTALLEELRAAVPSDQSPAITLVGHSTGAIFIANFLEKAEQVFHDRPDVKFRIVFLAPAITFERCARMINDHIHRISEIAKPKLAMRMFTMTDDAERNDRLLSVIYPHSLLYFISSVLEKDPFGDKAIVGMQRYYDAARYPDHKFADIAPFRRFIKDPGSLGHDHHVVWSIVNAGDGLSSTCISHGDFDDDPVTLSSLKHLIKHGF